MIDYWEHVTYKQTYDNVMEVMLDSYSSKEQFPRDWKILLKQIQQRFYPDEVIKPWTEYVPGEDALFDPENGRIYPHSLFLISLRYSRVDVSVENWLHLIELIMSVWNTTQGNVEYDEEKHTLTLYTGGWSGNEDIVSALHYTVFALGPHALIVDNECPAVWRFKMLKCLEVKK